MKVCLKCHFENADPADDELAECPQCHAIYSRVEAAMAAKAAKAASDAAADAALRERRANKDESRRAAVERVVAPMRTATQKVIDAGARALPRNTEGLVAAVRDRGARFVAALPLFPDEARRQRVAYIGAGIVALAVFLPFIRVPLLGTVNLAGRGGGIGMVLLPLAAGGAYLAFARRYTHMVYVGAAQLLLTLFVVGRFIYLARDLGAGDDNSPLGSAMRSAAAASIQFEFGVLILFGGIALVLAAGVAKHREGGGDE